MLFLILLRPVGFLGHALHALLMVKTDVEQGKPNHTSTFQAFPHISSINLFVKVNPMAKLNLNETRKGTLPLVGDTAKLPGKGDRYIWGDHKELGNNNPNHRTPSFCLFILNYI